MKLKNKFHHIFNSNNYKKCTCGIYIYKNSQPPIWTFEMEKNTPLEHIINSGFIKVYFCKECWDKLSIQERIDHYLNNMNKWQDPIFTIKSICDKSNVNPTKYIRKIKLEQLDERFSL